MLKKAGNFAQNLGRDGVAETVRMYRYRLYETYRDWRLGIRTKGFIQTDSLGHGEDCQPYQAINYRSLDAVFEYLQPSVGDVFLDYGCGMGRAVVTAATYPFRRVIGVELSSWLSNIARQNIESAAGKIKCPDVQILTVDATDLEVPDEVTAILLFNPFTGGVLSQVQQQIYESLQRTPRPLRVAYMHPKKEPNSFQACSWLQQQCELPTSDWHGTNFVVYQYQLQHLPEHKDGGKSDAENVG